jgi:hypothetical protein
MVGSGLRDLFSALLERDRLGLLAAAHAGVERVDRGARS